MQTVMKPQPKRTQNNTNMVQAYCIKYSSIFILFNPLIYLFKMYLLSIGAILVNNCDLLERVHCEPFALNHKMCIVLKWE